MPFEVEALLLALGAKAIGPGVAPLIALDGKSKLLSCIASG